MSKQIAPLKAQINVIEKHLETLRGLEESYSKAPEGSPFPVVMTAEAVGHCLTAAHSLLQEASSILKAELKFFEESAQQVALLETSSEEGAAAKLETLRQEIAAREPLTAGRAVFAMQCVPAALVFMAKVMENDRGYRG